MAFTVLLCFRQAGTAVVYPGFWEVEGCKWDQAQPSLPPTSSWENRLRSPGSQQGGCNREYWQSEAPVSICPRLALESRSHNFQIFMGVGENPVGPWGEENALPFFGAWWPRGEGTSQLEWCPQTLPWPQWWALIPPWGWARSKGPWEAPGHGLPGRRQARGSSGSKCWSGDLASLTQFQVWPVRTKRPHAWQRLCSASVPGCRRGACSFLLRVLFLGRDQRHWRAAAAQGDAGRAFTL